MKSNQSKDLTATYILEPVNWKNYSKLFQENGIKHSSQLNKTEWQQKCCSNCQKEITTVLNMPPTIMTVINIINHFILIIQFQIFKESGGKNMISPNYPPEVYLK